MAAFKRIVIATDFGEPSQRAMTLGSDLARTFGGRVFLVHVVEDIGAYFGAPEYGAAIGKIQSDLEDSARGRMNDLLSSAALRGLDVETAVLTLRTPAAAIVSFARDKQADLIVMGTHGRGKMASLLLGSVAERVVRAASCPVLVVHEHAHAAAPREAARVSAVA